MKIIEVFTYATILLLSFFASTMGNHKTLSYHEVVWYMDLRKQQTTWFLKEHPMPSFEKTIYHHNQKLIYYNNNGEMLHYLKLATNTYVTKNKSNYIIYGKTKQNIEFYNNKGDNLWIYKTLAYPLLSKSSKNILLLHPLGSSFSVIDSNLNTHIDNHYVSALITDYAFCDFDDSAVFATIEGSVVKYNHDRKIDFIVSAPKSKKNFLKTIVIGKKGRYIAGCSGLYPEYVFVLNKKGKLLWKVKTEENNRKNTMLIIDDEKNMLFRKNNNHIFFHDLKTGKTIGKFHFKNNKALKINSFNVTIADKKIMLAINHKSGSKVVICDFGGKIFFEKNLNAISILYGEIKENILLLETTSFILTYQLYF